MCVELFKIGSFTLYGYGFMIAIGCICALLVARYRAKHKNLDSDFILDLFCYCAIFGFLGAKLVSKIPKFWLSLIFDIFLIWAAINMIMK